MDPAPSGTDQSLFGQVATSAPAVLFTTGENGGVPRDLGDIFGPTGLAVDQNAPQLASGLTELVSGVYRAVTGTPAPVVASTTTPTILTPTTIIVLLVVAGIAWYALKSS